MLAPPMIWWHTVDHQTSCVASDQELELNFVESNIIPRKTCRRFEQELILTKTTKNIHSFIQSSGGPRLWCGGTHGAAAVPESLLGGGALRQGDELLRRVLLIPSFSSTYTISCKNHHQHVCNMAWKHHKHLHTCKKSFENKKISLKFCIKISLHAKSF